MTAAPEVQAAGAPAVLLLLISSSALCPVAHSAVPQAAAFLEAASVASAEALSVAAAPPANGDGSLFALASLISSLISSRDKSWMLASEDVHTVVPLIEEAAGVDIIITPR